MAAPSVNNEQAAAGGLISSYTPSNVTDSCLVVIVNKEDTDGSQDVTDITFDGSGSPVSLTKAKDVSSNGTGATNRCHIWYLLNPGTNAGDILVSVSGGRLTTHVATLGNVHQTTPIDSTGEDSGNTVTSVAPALTTTTADTRCISGVSTSTASNDHTVSGAAEISTTQFGTSMSGSAAHSEEAAAGSVTHTWSFTEEPRAAAAIVAFRSADAGGGPASILPTMMQHDHFGGGALS